METPLRNPGSPILTNGDGMKGTVSLVTVTPMGWDRRVLL